MIEPPVTRDPVASWRVTSDVGQVTEAGYPVQLTGYRGGACEQGGETLEECHPRNMLTGEVTAMPRYAFICEKCRKPFELTITLSEAHGVAKVTAGHDQKPDHRRAIASRRLVRSGLLETAAAHAHVEHSANPSCLHAGGSSSLPPVIRRIDSGPVWVATPSRCDSFIHYPSPV